MFRKMRLKRQELTAEDTEQILKTGTSGVLAVHGEDGYPYAVPLSYRYMDGEIIFHGAKAGHKIDAIKADSKVSFCVVAQDLVLPEQYTTDYRSAIAFGNIQIIEDEEEKRSLMSKLAEKYSPGHVKERNAEIQKGFPAFCIMKMRIEYMTGKRAM